MLRGVHQASHYTLATPHIRTVRPHIFQINLPSTLLAHVAGHALYSCSEIRQKTPTVHRARARARQPSRDTRNARSAQGARWCCWCWWCCPSPQSPELLLLLLLRRRRSAGGRARELVQHRARRPSFVTPRSLLTPGRLARGAPRPNANKTPCIRADNARAHGACKDGWMEQGGEQPKRQVAAAFSTSSSLSKSRPTSASAATACGGSVGCTK